MPSIRRKTKLIPTAKTIINSCSRRIINAGLHKWTGVYAFKKWGTFSPILLIMLTNSLHVLAGEGRNNQVSHLLY